MPLSADGILGNNHPHGALGCSNFALDAEHTLPVDLHLLPIMNGPLITHTSRSALDPLHHDPLSSLQHWHVDGDPLHIPLGALHFKHPRHPHNNIAINNGNLFVVTTIRCPPRPCNAFFGEHYHIRLYLVIVVDHICCVVGTHTNPPIVIFTLDTSELPKLGSTDPGIVADEANMLIDTNTLHLKIDEEKTPYAINVQHISDQPPTVLDYLLSLIATGNPTFLSDLDTLVHALGLQLSDIISLNTLELHLLVPLLVLMLEQGIPTILTHIHKSEYPKATVQQTVKECSDLVALDEETEETLDHHDVEDSPSLKPDTQVPKDVPIPDSRPQQPDPAEVNSHKLAPDHSTNESFTCPHTVTFTLPTTALTSPGIRSYPKKGSGRSD